MLKKDDEKYIELHLKWDVNPLEIWNHDLSWDITKFIAYDKI